LHDVHGAGLEAGFDRAVIVLGQLAGRVVEVELVDLLQQARLLGFELLSLHVRVRARRVSGGEQRPHRDPHGR
jgi:hypothetical protein